MAEKEASSDPEVAASLDACFERLVSEHQKKEVETDSSWPKFAKNEHIEYIMGLDQATETFSYWVSTFASDKLADGRSLTGCNR